MRKSLIALILSCVTVFTSCTELFVSSESVSNSGESHSEVSIEKDSSGENSSKEDFSSEDVGSSWFEDSSKEDSSSSEENSSNEGGATDEEHEDENNDGVCDICQTSVVVTFDFYAVNDLHGKFADTDDQPGVDELSTYLKNAKSRNENTIFLSSGDMWQGGSESNLTKGLIVTDWMSELGFASMTIGNHEYDWGEDAIIANEAQAEFPFLALNIFDSTTNQLADYCQPSVMVEQNGVQIGIIGAVGDCYSSISPDKVEDVYFKTGSQLTALVKAEANKLREQGADFIVYSLHDGYESSNNYTQDITGNLGYYDTALSNGYVDLVFEGHTHQRYVIRDSQGVYHLQGGGDNDGITHATVAINYANQTSSVKKAEYLSSSNYTSLQDDPVVNELLEKYADEIAIGNKTLGYNAKYRSSSVLCQLLAQLYYEAGVEKWGSKYDIVLGGGFLSARSPYSLDKGDVLYSDIQMIFPFDNEIVLCSISGSDLKNKFFETTNSRYYIAYGDYGESVKASIDLNKTYYIIVDKYTSQYAYNNLTEIEYYDTTTYPRDLLAAYIEAGGLAK